MHGPIRLLALLSIVCVTGCAASPGASITCTTSTAHESWVRSQGGLAGAQLHRRVESICIARLGAQTLAGCHLHVLESDGAVAYAWPDRRIYLSRGLVERLTAVELAAAVAHELGHLLDDGHLDHPVTLAGRHSSDDREARADRIGRDLLIGRGLDPDAMTRMLDKVRDASSTSLATRAHLAERIALLHSSRSR